MSEIERDCPFCRMDDHAELVEDGSGGYVGAYLKCHNCHARGPLHMFFPPDDEFTGKLYLHNENIHENREDVVPAAIDDWNSRFERTCRDDGNGCCSNCGSPAPQSYASAFAESPKYCPECGARVVSE